MAIFFSFFSICGSEMLNLLILCDLGAETSISDVHCLSLCLNTVLNAS